MTVGYVAANGADLDVLFAVRTSTAAAATGFKSAGGTDLNQRFEPRGATTAIANTGFIAGATDLSQIFKGISADVIILTNQFVNAVSLGTTIAGYQLQAVGDVITNNNGSLTDVGDWVSPKASAPGSYEVRATIVSGGLNGGDATGTWLALSTNRSWVVNRPIPGNASCVLTIEIRLGGTTLATCTVNLSATRN